MTKYLKHLVRDFFAICGCILIGTSIFLTVFQVKMINSSLFWQVIIVAFIAALLDFILEGKSQVSKKSYLIRKIVHFILINILLFSSAYMFRWFFLRKMGIMVVFEIIIILVYVLVGFSVYFIDNIHAKKLNEKLIEYKKRRREDNQ